jgi:acetate---CoA ligase (ADP-forming)
VGLESFVRAGSIAVVGASERNIIARIALENLQRVGFPGRVVGIHPSGTPMGGVQVVPSLGEAGPIDLCLLAIGAPRLEHALREAAEAGVPAAVIPGAGANEGGPEVEPVLRQVIEDTGIEVIGPNCMGFASLHKRVVPYVGTLDADLQPGRVALVSQSGSVCELFTALPWRVGFSHVVSVGNELGLDLTGALEYLVDDERTEVVGLFIEGLRRPDAFRAALRRAAEAGKPVVALKVGRSDVSRSGTVAHTGALAGDARVFSAVLRDAGAIEVTDLDEMLVTLELLGKGLRRPPNRVVYAGDSGGEANLFADLAADHHIELTALQPSAEAALRDRFPSIGSTANPLDLWALGDPEATYADGARLLVEEQPHLVVLGLDKFLARTEPERAFVRAGVGAVPEPGSVILMALAGSDCGDQEILRTCWDRGIPVVRGAERTLRSLVGLARGQEWRTQGQPARTGARLEDAARLAAGTTEWSEHAAKRLLAAAGIPVTEEEEVDSPEAAVKAARRIGFPVVLKTAGPGLAHKSESGGVLLGLGSEEAVAEAARELLTGAPCVLVAEQRRADLELVVGAFIDEQFGPCAVLGLGGVWTEALQESVVVAGPGSEVTIRRALRSSGWGSLVLDGARGRSFPAERVIGVGLTMLDLIAECGEYLDTVEINPLFLDGGEVIAVDALAVPRGQISRGEGMSPAPRIERRAGTGGSDRAPGPPP